MYFIFYLEKLAHMYTKKAYNYFQIITKNAAPRTYKDLKKSYPRLKLKGEN